MITDPSAILVICASLKKGGCFFLLKEAHIYPGWLQTRPFVSSLRNSWDFRGLRYVRYADDFLLSFIGPKAEAEVIKQQLEEFLRDELKLELSQTKTLITHARTETARFLGYEVQTLNSDAKHTKGMRRINGKIGFRVPKDVIEVKSRKHTRKGKPIHRAGRTPLSGG